MSADVRAEVAEVLAVHRPTGDERNDCSCGWWHLPRAGTALHAAHLADALAPLFARREAEARAEVVGPIEALIEKWRYKGEFGWGPWQEGHSPDPEGQVLDECASDIRAALAARSDQGGA